MRRIRAAVALGLMVGLVSLAPAGVLAATAPPGTVIEMPEVQSIGATLWNVICVYGIPIGGVLLGAGGLTSQVRSRVGQTTGPVAGIGSGIGLQFVPSGITGAGRVAPAATGWLAPLSPWGQFWQGLTGHALLVDPVVWVMVGAMAYVVTRSLKRHHSCAIGR